MISSVKALLSSVLTDTANEETRVTPVTDESVHIETVQSDIVTVTEENWALHNSEGIIYIDLHNESQVHHTPHSLITDNPPRNIHS